MASEHGYTTVVALEPYAGQDYSAIDAKYTDTIIEAQITQAEYIINAKTGVDYTGSVPDGAKGAALEISKNLMNNLLVSDGYGTEKSVIITEFVDELIDTLLKQDTSELEIKIIRNVTDNFWTR